MVCFYLIFILFQSNVPFSIFGRILSRSQRIPYILGPIISIQSGLKLKQSDVVVWLIEIERSETFKKYTVRASLHFETHLLMLGFITIRLYKYDQLIFFGHSRIFNFLH